jgi:hypothetical protein
VFCNGLQDFDIEANIIHNTIQLVLIPVANILKDSRYDLHGQPHGILLQLAHEPDHDVLPVGRHLLVLEHNLGVLLHGHLEELGLAVRRQEDPFEEGDDLLQREVVGVAGQLVQQLEVFAGHQADLRLQDLVDQEVHMRAFEAVAHLLQQFVDCQAGLVVAFLGC